MHSDTSKEEKRLRPAVTIAPVILTLVLLASISLAGYGAAPTGELLVQVFDQDFFAVPLDKSVPGAKVLIQNDETGATIMAATDSNGRARFTGLPDGRYLVGVENEAYIPIAVLAGVSAQNGPEVVTLALRPFPFNKNTFETTVSTAILGVVRGQTSALDITLRNGLNSSGIASYQVEQVSRLDSGVSESQPLAASEYEANFVGDGALISGPGGIGSSRLELTMRPSVQPGLYRLAISTHFSVEGKYSGTQTLDILLVRVT